MGGRAQRGRFHHHRRQLQGVRNAATDNYRVDVLNEAVFALGGVPADMMMMNEKEDDKLIC